MRQRPKAGDNLIPFVYHSRPIAEVVELVDTTDSKSVAFAGLGVRVPLRYQIKTAKVDACVKSQLLHHRLQ